MKGTHVLNEVRKEVDQTFARAKGAHMNFEGSDGCRAQVVSRYVNGVRLGGR